MRNRELTVTLAHLQRLLADPRLETAHREKLRKAKKELVKVRRSGKPSQDKVFRAVKLISDTLVEVVSANEIPTNPEGQTVAR